MVLPTNDPLQHDGLFQDEGSPNAWLRVCCVGRLSNRSGVGARLRLHARLAGQTVRRIREISTRTGCFAGGQDGLLAHFGLAEASQPDLLEIDWPSGVHRELANVDARQAVVVEPNRPSITPFPRQGAVLGQYRVPSQL